MKYICIKDDDILNASTMLNHILLLDGIWHADYYIVRVSLLSKEEMAYIYGLFDDDECKRIKNMCLISDDMSVVVVVDLSSDDMDGVMTYISDVVFKALSGMGCIHEQSGIVCALNKN